jgi:effector-binding domain-containing protein
MGLRKQGITYKQYDEGLVASIRTTISSRQDIHPIIEKIQTTIPDDMIKGPPFCIFQFVTSVKDGHDVEIGFPVTDAFKAQDLVTRKLPPYEVLSLTHTASLETLSQSYGQLYGAAAHCGIISDEFCREIYTDWDDHGIHTVELQFIIHNWHALLVANIDLILEKDACIECKNYAHTITIESTAKERFEKTKEIVEKFEKLLNEDQTYDILSRCAHRFPQSQIDKLRHVYQESYAKKGNASHAVNAVIEFMASDPGWGEKPVRKGNVIYSSKGPRDPKAFKQATTDEERRKAYCFCPIIRDRLAQEMPVAFCYCGAGWYRQQWEGAIGQPVRVEIVESLLKGDNRCQFAIYLPDDIFSGVS